MADMKFGLVHAEAARLQTSNFSAASGTTVKIGSLPRGSIVLSVHLVNVTIMAPTTAAPSFLLGSLGDDDFFVAAGDFGELTAGYYNATTGRGVLTSNCDVYAKLTYGSVMTAGEWRVAVEYIPPSTNRQLEPIFD